MVKPFISVPSPLKLPPPLSAYACSLPSLLPLPLLLQKQPALGLPLLPSISPLNSPNSSSKSRGSHPQIRWVTTPNNVTKNFISHETNCHFKGRVHRAAGKVSKSGAAGLGFEPWLPTGLQEGRAQGGAFQNKRTVILSIWQVPDHHLLHDRSASRIRLRPLTACFGLARSFAATWSTAFTPSFCIALPSSA